LSARKQIIACAMTAMLLLVGCAGPAATPTPAPTPAPTATPTAAPTATAAPLTLTLAHSYSDTQPQIVCGVNRIAEEVAAANVGLKIEIFGASQLGGDADRVDSVIAGDIDMDIQGASALGRVYAPISAVDGAFVFDDSQHLYNYFSGAASDALKQGFYEATGVTALGGWNNGGRQFTANVPIRTPEDLVGLRMRFPPTPVFLLNAEAMGADAVEVAYEELYLALQQGTVDGQENPLTNIKAINLPEVQDYVSLSSHQLSSNVVIIGPVWDDLSAAQQAALQAAVNTAMTEVPVCVADAETAILDEWRTSGAIEIIDDVDREAFRAKAEPYLRSKFTPEQIEVLDAIRSLVQ
jgi:tripartite ATP-independent transporter DctP family solute receptor